jgi:hypothetical protein
MNPVDRKPHSSTPRGDRTPEVELERRVFEVTNLLVDGEPYHAIVSHCRSRWKCGQRTVEDYVRLAYAGLREQFKDNVREQTAIQLQRLESLYNASFKAKDYRTAASCISSICKLLGLNREHVRVTHEVGISASQWFLAIRGGTPEQAPEKLHLTASEKVEELPCP